jgi:3-oxoadipate enol-lactonase
MTTSTEPTSAPTATTTLAIASDSFADPWQRVSSVVLQHGFARNHRFWTGWVPYLGRRHKVLRPDLPGCGDSAGIDPAGLDFAGLASLLADSVRTHDNRPVHYIGESLGGMLGVYLAATQPELIASLSLMSTPIYAGPTVHQMQAVDQASWADAVTVMGMREWWLESRARMRGAGRPDKTDSDRWIVDQLELTSVQAAAALTKIIESVDLREYAHKVTCPVRILVPEGSKYANRPDQFEYYRAFANHSVDVVAGANHEMYVENVDLVAPQVATFIDGLESR